MERTGTWTRGASTYPRRTARGLRPALLFLGGALLLGGCYVVPAHTAYVAPAPVYVAPAPVYVVPGPVYRGGGYGWRRYGRY